MQILAKHRSQLITPYAEALIFGLEKAPHDTYIRNTIRIFQDLEVPENLQGLLYDICFKYLNSYESPIAVKVFSLTVLRNIAFKYTDMIDELITTIEAQMDTGSQNFRNRATLELALIYTKKG